MAQLHAGPDSMNVDFRIAAILLAFASRSDLLDVMLADKDKPDADALKWKKLTDVGFDRDILEANLYLFEDGETQKALRRTQLVMQTMSNLIQYDDLTCPSDAILTQITNYTRGLTRVLPAPGKGE